MTIPPGVVLCRCDSAAVMTGVSKSCPKSLTPVDGTAESRYLVSSSSESKQSRVILSGFDEYSISVCKVSANIVFLVETMSEVSEKSCVVLTESIICWNFAGNINRCI